MVQLHAAYQPESTQLLINNSKSEGSPSLQQMSVCSSCSPSKDLCLPSKAAILIVLWTIIVGATYHNIMGFSVLLVVSISPPNTILSEYEPLPYPLLAIVTMFYPLSGFIADVCCGRLKSVVVSLIFLLCCWILVTLGLFVSVTTIIDNYNPTQNQGILVIILVSCSLLSFVAGLVGYQANYIQLGLDQLFEAPKSVSGSLCSLCCLGFLFRIIAFPGNIFNGVLCPC